jgi:cell division protein FtsA
MKNYEGSIMNKPFSDHIVAIDIGTTKICTLIAQRLDNNTIDILGIGQAPSTGLQKGVVVDITPTVHAIKTSIQEAELMAGVTVESAHIGISGSHISSHTSSGMIAIKHQEVTPQEVQAVLNAAQAIPLSDGHQILHVIPQLFTIDGNQKVQDPIGMFGVRLEAQVHIITGATGSVQNLVRCCQLAGIKVQDIILEPIASAHAVLSPDEQELGVAMLDIGGGTSDFVVYQKGSIKYSKIFSIAGTVFTNDIAVCLQTSIKDAERVKKEFGIAHPQSMINNNPISVTTVHGLETKYITPSDLLMVLEPRAQELMELIHREIHTNNLIPLTTSGLVITGGGSLLNGLDVIARSTLGMPVRIGRPHIPYAFKTALESPIYATGYGLLVYVAQRFHKIQLHTMSGTLSQRLWYRMRSWVGDLF